jgi:hypothetical protein
MKIIPTVGMFLSYKFEVIEFVQIVKISDNLLYFDDNSYMRINDFNDTYIDYYGVTEIDEIEYKLRK